MDYLLISLKIAGFITLAIYLRQIELAVAKSLRLDMLLKASFSITGAVVYAILIQVGVFIFNIIVCYSYYKMVTGW